MPPEAFPQIYLVTPPVFDVPAFADRLAGLLDGFEIACVRLSLAARSEDAIAQAADALRALCHARDVPLVLSEHVLLAQRLGLDGVHLTGLAQVRAARKALGPDAVVGVYARASRHDGLTAGEMGADYVSFGPLGTSAVGDGSTASRELFEWWSEMIEIPVVAEGGLTPDLVRDLSPITDFVALGDEIWSQAEGDAAAALKSYVKALT